MKWAQLFVVILKSTSKPKFWERCKGMHCHSCAGRNPLVVSWIPRVPAGRPGMTAAVNICFCNNSAPPNRHFSLDVGNESAFSINPRPYRPKTMLAPKLNRTGQFWVRTTFGGLRRTINFVLLCNPPKWDAPDSFLLIARFENSSYTYHAASSP